MSLEAAFLEDQVELSRLVHRLAVAVKQSEEGQDARVDLIGSLIKTTYFCRVFEVY